MKLALVQLNSVWEDRPANLRRAEEFVRQAAEADCDVIVFPETFTSGFSMNIPAAADNSGETTAFLAKQAQQYHIHIIAGFAEAAGNDKARNVATAHDRKGVLLAHYTKIYPFSYAQEDRHYLAGTDPVTFDIDGVPASVFICYDLRFPEVFRRVARDVHLIFVIANWPCARKQHWDLLLQARAIENQCFVVGVNRIGNDPHGLDYPGSSQILDPMGTIICNGDETEEWLMAEIAPALVTQTRSTFPFLQDMRPCTIALTQRS